MKTHSPIPVLAALGVLAFAQTFVPAALAQTAPDTSQWKCKACPYPQATTGNVEVGLGAVSDDSAKFGDYTGLERKGAYLVLGGELFYRNDNGYYARVRGNELGLDSRQLAGETGREGLYSLRLGYGEIPRHYVDDAQSPYLGNGSGILTLPAGYPTAGTSTMPLGSTLKPVELGMERKRYEIGGSWVGLQNWKFNLQMRHDTREGTRPGSISFFAGAAQVALPVDQVTDQVEATASYFSRKLQLTVGYAVSNFRSDNSTLTVTSPFLPVIPGATRGQLALAPDNQFHNFFGSAGYEITPAIRASGDVSFGRMTQDAGFAAATLTPSLAASIAPLPRTSLDGRVDTFNSNLRITAAVADNLRLNASYARNVRDNRTGIAAYPGIATDIFLESPTRSNRPNSFWQDRWRLGADYRGPGTVKLNAGVEIDKQERSYQEVVNTRDATVWARLSAQPLEAVGLSLKLARADRTGTPYGTLNWLESPENPLLRKYNLADRQRGSINARADLTVSEKLSVGVAVDATKDDYDSSAVGLKQARSVGLSIDAAWAIAEGTRLQAYAQTERIRSEQGGSQGFVTVDWNAANRDRFNVVGLNIRHAAIPDKLDLGADLTFSRSRGDVNVNTGLDGSLFPSTKTSLDSLRLYASYKLDDKITLTGGLQRESYDTQDWHTDGVMPATLQNLLAFGNQPQHYRVTALRLGMRYKF